MITKGEVQQNFDYTKGNKISVRIPIFESAGDTDKFIIDCLVCEAPGVSNYYRAGDIVWIGFERDEVSNPVILGKLMLSSEQNDNSAITCNSLTITSNANLPNNTMIGNTDLSTLITTINTSVENKDNKVSVINKNSTDLTYPSTKAVYTYAVTKLVLLNGETTIDSDTIQTLVSASGLNHLFYNNNIYNLTYRYGGTLIYSCIVDENSTLKYKTIKIVISTRAVTYDEKTIGQLS